MKIHYAFVAAALAACSSPALSERHEAKSNHFIVYADDDAEAVKRYAQKLERFDAAVRVARGVPDVPTGAATRVTLFLVDDMDEIKKLYAGRRWEDSSVAGFYMAKSTGSVAFVPQEGGRGKWSISGESIFFHEYTHHLMMQDADRPLPMWLTEGFAEFFANPKFNDDGSVVIGAPPLYRAEALYSTGRLSLEKMLSGDYRALSQQEFSSIYGFGWLLTHLLSFDLSRRGQLTQYLDDIRGGVPPGDAARRAFGDIKSLDRELWKYFKDDVFTVATIPASKLKLAPVTVRRLGPGEAETVELKMRLERGGDRFPTQLAAQAREVAERYPAEAAVHTTLAHAELHAGNPAAAVEAADRALAINGSADQALLAKAEGMMQLAKAAPARADWEAIRAVIAKANHIDPENAAPLVLYYRSFVEEGKTPPETAAEGLEYAIALAPSDAKLRLTAVGWLIDSRRFSDASRLLVPLAYSPHQGKWRDAVVGLFEAVNANDGPAAKEKWKATVEFFDD